MAVSLLTSKILAAGAGALAGYLLYKPETKTGGNNGGKNKEDKSNNNYIPTSSEVITATANIQRAENPYVFGRVIEGDVTDSRINSAFYFGDKNKPYDPFYDYTDFHLKTEIDSLAASNPLAILRARIIPEYTAVAKRYVGPIGVNILAEGECIDLRFRVEVFNPSAYPIAINKLGIASVQYNNEDMYTVQTNYKSNVGRFVGLNRNLSSFHPAQLLIAHYGEELFVDRYSEKYKASNFEHFVKDDYDNSVDINYIHSNLSNNQLLPYDRKEKTPLYFNYGNWLEAVKGLTEERWQGFTYPNYTPENVPAQGSFFQDWFLNDLYSFSSISRFSQEGAFLRFKANIPTAAQPNLLVGLKFANDDTSTEGVIYTSLYSGNQPPTVPVDYKFNYVSENFGNIYAGLLDAKNAGIVDMWQTIHEKYDADFDSCFGVDMAAYWYLWAVNKAALEAKIKSLLGVSGAEYWDPTRTPIQKKRLLDKVGEAGSEKRKQINDLLLLYKNVFSTELTITDAENTYKEAYKNDVAKGVTLLPSLKYWAEQAAGAAPESIAPGTSSRTSNPNRNAVPDYRGTSAGTSTTTTTTTTNGGGRGGSTTTSSGSGTSTRGVNGLAPGYNAASM